MKKKTYKIELSEEEYDLIESGRNYKRSRPNGDPELRFFVEMLFTEWLEGKNDE